MKRFRATAAAVLALSLILGACGGGGGNGGEGASDLPPDYVLVKGSKYIPSKLTVAAGTEVTFDFDDGSLAHNALADDKSFDTGVHTNKSVTVKLDKPGTYKYICTLHPTMKGEITVE